MKKFISYFSFIFVAVLFSSCEDVVQIKLDEGSKIYVIDAFVNDLPGKQTVKITTNDSYFSNREAPPVAGATVLLRDLTANKDYLFTHAGNGNYEFDVQTNAPISLVDHQYELNVAIDGSIYTSKATQKRTAGIDSLSAEFYDGSSGGFGPGTDPFFLCTLWAKDRTDSKTDYYWVKTFRNDSLLFGPSDINVSIDGTNGAVNIEGVDSTAFTPPITYIGFKMYKSGNSCGVQIHSISRETYYFFIQAAQQINNGGLFATTPENVKTNIVTPADAKTKAIGWFNMATVASARIVLP